MTPFSDSAERPEGMYNALSLRRRSVWEAADSGVLLWRHSFLYFIPFFAAPVFVTACGLRFLPDNLWYLPYLILWWLKPLFDRLVLRIVSVRFFGGRSADTAFSRLWELRRGLLGDLLWRRFSPGRAACMPIRVLERPGRKQFRQRKKALAAGGLNFCFLVSALGLALEAVLLLGEILFIAMTTQMFFPSALDYIQNNFKTVEIFIFASFCFNFVLVESVYVCMGFGLYINSRVEVEGWDLQLLFQKFADTKTESKVSAGLPGQGLKPVLFMALFLAVSQAVYAGEPVVFFPEEFPSPGAESLDKLEYILASSDFGSEKEGWSIRFKNSLKEREMPDINLAPWAEKIRQIFGFLLRFFVILAIAAFAGFAVYWHLKSRRKGIFRSRSRGKSYAHPLLFSESPESLFARADDSFRRGSLREAWAACFSGCIGAYSRYHSLFFPADATEYGCLALVREALPEEAGEFGDLVQSWVLFAYGERLPVQGAFERALVYGRSLMAGTPKKGSSGEP